jgi:hypothetical protein
MPVGEGIVATGDVVAVDGQFVGRVFVALVLDVRLRYIRREGAVDSEGDDTMGAFDGGEAAWG